MPSTIDDLRALGYDLGIAQGDVGLEEAALAQAREDANLVPSQAQTVTRQTLSQLDTEGRLPFVEDDEAATIAARHELAARIADDALAELTVRATTRIDFHERALAIAQEMPNVWHVSQTAETAEGDRIGVAAVYVSCDDAGAGWDEAAQEALDFLADADAYAERARQAVEGPPVQPDPGPTIAERVATVLAGAPELGDKTRAALLEALDDDGGAP